jgi:hypothetical protein
MGGLLNAIRIIVVILPHNQIITQDLVVYLFMFHFKPCPHSLVLLWFLFQSCWVQTDCFVSKLPPSPLTSLQLGRGGNFFRGIKGTASKTPSPNEQSKAPLLLRAARGEAVERVPVWM